jgi:hypothetical protein
VALWLIYIQNLLKFVFDIGRSFRCIRGIDKGGGQAQLVTSKSSWMEGRMLYQLPPGSPSIPRPYKSRYTCTQQIKTPAPASAWRAAHRLGTSTSASVRRTNRLAGFSSARARTEGVDSIPNGVANRSGRNMITCFTPLLTEPSAFRFSILLL